MGLDVYLHRCEDLNQDVDSDVEVQQDSKVYPEHMFKVGYLRSSYNSGGINHVLRNFLGTDLYDVFSPPEGEYRFKPDWRMALNKAQDLRDRFARFVKENGSLHIEKHYHNPFIDSDKYPTSEKEALEVFLKTYEQYKGKELKDWDGEPTKYKWFSNRDGSYFMGEPERVMAILPGTYDGFRGDSQPCMYVISQVDNEDYAWYKQALEITVEMCEWVLSQPNPDHYILHWSA